MAEQAQSPSFSSSKAGFILDRGGAAGVETNGGACCSGIGYPTPSQIDGTYIPDTRIGGLAYDLTVKRPN